MIAIGADPSTRIISFTVTEAGYYLDAKNRLDLSFPDLAADVAAAKQGKPGGTIYAALTAILRERMRRSGGKVTLLNCDNLRHNGERFRGGLLQFIDLVNDAALHDWVSANTSSPNAMVDRITPRPTPDVAERVRRATGWDDAAPVMSESFIQWVIEDDFCNGRPAWERVGVEMVDSVNPYEEAKIRILNASHSGIAWAGTLVGYEFIHEGTHDPKIRADRARLRHQRRDPVSVHAGASQPHRPRRLPRCRAGSLRQSRHPRLQSARGDGWLLQDPGLHRPDGARAPGKQRVDSERRDAPRAVPRVSAAVAPR